MKSALQPPISTSCITSGSSIEKKLKPTERSLLENAFCDLLILLLLGNKHSLPQQELMTCPAICFQPQCCSPESFCRILSFAPHPQRYGAADYLREPLYHVASYPGASPSYERGSVELGIAGMDTFRDYE